jgi:hypothetical protein
MTREEVEYLHNQLEGLNTDQIQLIVTNELGIVRIKPRSPFVHYWNDEPDYNISELKTPEELETICKDTIKKNSSTIKEILQKHPNYTNYVIDIIMLLAPAIAQQYLGISAMAIVGSITIICKQGIHSYLH